MEQQMEQQMREEIKKNHLLDDSYKASKKVSTNLKSADIDSLTKSTKSIEDVESISQKEHQINKKSYTNAELKDIYENMSLDRIGYIWKVYKNKKLTESELNEFNILRKVYENKSGHKLNANTQGKK